MTAFVTPPARPEPNPKTGPVISARHRAGAVGSGLAGLTAARALKHDLVTIADALAFVTRTAAQGAVHLHNQESAPAILAGIGVLITLCVAFPWPAQQSPKGWC